MRESKKDTKIILKSFWRRWKGIRNEMSLFGKIFEIIVIITTIIILGYMFYIARIYDVVENFPTFLYLLIIILPISIIYSKIRKKALKKYNEKLEKKRINLCIYCNGKIDGFTSICPYCGKELDDRHYKDYTVIESSEIERKFKEKSAEKETLLPEQEEIISFSKKSDLLIILVPIIVVIIVFEIIILFLFGVGAMIGMLLGGFIILLFYIIAIYLIILTTIISKFSISKHDIKLKIEKKIFYQINWADLKDVEIFKMSFIRGYFLKFNSFQEYKLIGLRICSFNGSKQKKIIKTLFKYSEKLNKSISIKKAFGPFIDEITMKELYDEIFTFARSQRFILKSSHY
ncbi:MAG: hypothetical protein EU529_11205 [Promethearchaeota archaeon]|nr:MAG: hypothetical protein EU529_11205 [Candidatus Lokiarchaeota archaeon]